jgi:hypothetical protein
MCYVEFTVLDTGSGAAVTVKMGPSSFILFYFILMSVYTHQVWPFTGAV